MKLLVPKYSCLKNPWLGGYCPPDPHSLCPQLNLLNSPTEQNSWVCHWTKFLGMPLVPVEESSSCHPRELRQMKWDFKSILCLFLNSEAILQKEFFLHCQPVNQQFCLGVLRVLVGAAGIKCPSSGIHRTGCCIMITRHATWIHGFFWCVIKIRWWWYLASVLLRPILRGLFWFSKIETWLKG